MRRYVAAAAAFAAFAAFTQTANAGDVFTRSKWKNCETFKAGTSQTATFTDVAATHGANRYMVKREIKWQVLIGSGRWRTDDHETTQTQWIRVEDPTWDFVTSIGDVTNWGAEFNERWRAVVTFKLIRNRRGPVDKRVETAELTLNHGRFTEKGSSCAAFNPNPVVSAPNPG